MDAPDLLFYTSNKNCDLFSFNLLWNYSIWLVRETERPLKNHLQPEFWDRGLDVWKKKSGSRFSWFSDSDLNSRFDAIPWMRFVPETNSFFPGMKNLSKIAARDGLGQGPSHGPGPRAPGSHFMSELAHHHHSWLLLRTNKPFVWLFLCFFYSG